MVAVSVLVGANPTSKWKQLGRANPHKKSLCIRNPFSVFATRGFFLSPEEVPDKKITDLLVGLL